MISNTIYITQIPTSEYIAKYRDVDKFIEFCKVCPNYNRVWSCPPFERESLEGLPVCGIYDRDKFSIATIIGVKIDIDEQTRFRPTNIEERNALTRDILFGVRKEIDEMLLPLEQQIQPSLLYYAGSCRLCAPNDCRRVDNEPCCYPDKMRSTLEADGFDIGRTTSELLGIELKWCEGCELPPYYTLVYGLLSNHSTIDRIEDIFSGMTNVTAIKHI